MGEDRLELCSPPSRGNLLEVRRRLGEVLAHGSHQRLRRPKKYPAIPVVIAGGQELICPLLIGLLGKTVHAIQAITQLLAGFDVSISRLGTVRGNAHHHDVLTRCSKVDGFGDNFAEILFVLDYMVSREHPNDCVRVLPSKDECGQSDRWSGITRHRFGDDLFLRHLLQLPADYFKDVIVGDNPKIAFIGQRQQSLNGLLNHRLIAIEVQHLLGHLPATARPEARTASASQDYGIEIGRFRHWIQLVETQHAASSP